MALADRRPLGFPVTSTPASPAFNPKTLSLNSASSTSSSSENQMAHGFKTSMDDIKGKFSESDVKPLTPEKSLSPVELSPTLRSISPDSLMTSESYRKLNATTIVPSSTTSITSNSSRGSSPAITSGANLNVLKKPKNTSRAPIATGISTTIPVTGEKPKPSQKDDPSLEDDVLYAIFVILYEKDPEGSGMTVKQICDILVEQHPDMANLSTKTSNLVSAKLNAYVKRVEKGDSSLKYALSRDWADASPKRMVYVYRGLLTEDFHLHVKNVMEVQKQQQHTQPEIPSATKIDDSNSLEAGKQANLMKPRRQTMFDLGVTKNTFMDSALDKSNLVVPYSSAPVAASLTEAHGDSKKISPKNPQESDLEFEDFEVFNDIEDEDDNDINLEMNDMYIDSFKKNGKRSKSLSYLSSSKKPKILTAAAAAPRAPRTPSSHNPNAAAAAAALHAAAFKAISAPSSQSSDTSLKLGADAANDTNTTCPSNKNWLSVVRSGFLTQDIGTPEEISLSDLDKFFT